MGRGIEYWAWDKRGNEVITYKVYTEDPEISARIASWKESTRHCIYYHPDGRKTRDYIIPKFLLKRLPAKDLIYFP